MPFSGQWMEYLRFSYDALTANKIRFILTTLGIFLGVTAIIVIFTAIQSINSYVEEEFSSLGGNSLYLSKFPWVITGNYWELRNRPEITLDDYDIIKDKIETARWISPQIEAMRTIEYRNKSLQDVLTIGSNEQYVFTDNADPDYGRFFTEMEVYRAHPVCVIGQNVREELFGVQDPLGKRIKINGYSHRIVGVLKEMGSFFGFNLDNQVIIPYTTFQGISHHRRGITIAFRTEDPAMLDDLQAEIRGEIRRIRKLAPAEPDNFAINQQTMLTDFYNNLTRTSYLVVFIIGTISLIVGGIGIMNIMLVSVTERTKEIGIRKAIGASRKNIIMQFLTESITISSLGGVVGIIFGFLIAQFLLQQIKLDATVSLTTILIGYGFSAFVGIVSGMYPAYRAAKLHPIDALRYE
ncbi:MAG: FtsX-like permease family protein [Calditrichaeota bacterium]|nr:ABC transporter permease [Calditrichota bacterium]RQW02300.1 MAG: FtsX-like permease family protein [Calditrichota bacterium]